MSKMPQIIKNIFLGIGIGIYILSLLHYPVYSNTLLQLQEEITKKEKEIAEKESVLEGVERRIKEISSSNYSLSQKINLLNEEIQTLEKNIEETEGEIEEKVKGIEEKKGQLEKTKVLIDDISGDLYIQSRYKLTSFFLNGANWFTIVESLYVRKSAISTLKKEIEKIGGEFSSLAESKAELDKEKEDLDKQREGLDEAHRLLAEEKAKVQAELSKEVASKSGLSAEITDLNAKVSQLQAALIAARSAGFISSGGTVGDVLGTTISQAPAGYFGVFSIGAYTHRNGMSQWAAKARADAGQSYRKLIEVDYPTAILDEGHAEPQDIIVRGTGNSCYVQGYDKNGNPIYERYYNETVSFADYLNRIYEMPASWNIEALKAQAIAARTYALHKIRTQGYVIPNQSNQVYKDCDNAQGWKDAVVQTKGQVMTIDGLPFASEYAAVHGAWGNATGWDTESGGGENWYNDSWEKISGVNWFYRSWFINGSGYAGETCGHSPFLSPEEMMIIINAYLVQKGEGLRATPDLSRLLPSDYGKCQGGARNQDYGRTDKVPYSLAELQGLLLNPVRSFSAPYVGVAFGNGITNNVVFYTNRGVLSIPGSSFKSIYNQMAPGHMRIQQQSHYAFFNVERA
ncbi:MAG: SpoIID/LytB domain-containing protein [Candidatus Dojkabacteria bacterium]|nr:SpoIID/LytB domain-containing protein [Candidatus Dojkabacteria bacterium]